MYVMNKYLNIIYLKSSLIINKIYLTTIANNKLNKKMNSPSYSKIPNPSFTLSNKINFQELFSSKQSALAPISLEVNDNILSPREMKTPYLEECYEKYNSNVYLVSCMEINKVSSAETGIEFI